MQQVNKMKDSRASAQTNKARVITTPAESKKLWHDCNPHSDRTGAYNESEDVVSQTI